MYTRASTSRLSASLAFAALLGTSSGSLAWAADGPLSLDAAHAPGEEISLSPRASGPLASSPDARRDDGPGDRVRVRDARERRRMEDYIRDHVDPRTIVTTLRLPYGDVVDCVDMYAQPGLRQADGRMADIQLAPTTLPDDLDGDAARLGGDYGDLPAQQDYGQGDLICPEGSVPIRRLTMETLERFETLEQFRSKHGAYGEDERDGATSLHQYAHAYRNVSNRGAQSALNLWNPYTEETSEFSLSQIWVVRGSGSSRETVETGWQKYYDLYGDYYSRLFIYFTPDNYGSGGCYNLDCGAFVQTNSSVYIGGKWSTYSTLGGEQRAVTLAWYKDGSSGHWWLRYGSTWVGYYPQSRFDSAGLASYASTIDFGGEIIDNQTGGLHTRTDMGSGHWPSEGWTYAAYQRNISYFNTSLALTSATGLTPSATDDWCYALSLYNGGSWGVYFFYGGSGYNTYCQ